jgi:hypothetical protein
MLDVDRQTAGWIICRISRMAGAESFARVNLLPGWVRVEEPNNKALSTMPEGHFVRRIMVGATGFEPATS